MGISVVPDRANSADMRGHTSPWRLAYPPGSVVVLAGIPGSGKTTLLHRLFPPDRPGDEVEVVDSDQVRLRFEKRLPPIPYPAYRPLVHAVHYTRIRQAVTENNRRAVVIHDTGTHRLLREWIRRLTHNFDRSLHLLLLDVSPEDAWSGQLRRARRLSTHRFARQTRTWRRFVDAATAEPTGLGAYSSCVVADRPAAGLLRHISFDGRTGGVMISRADR